MPTVRRRDARGRFASGGGGGGRGGQKAGRSLSAAKGRSAFGAKAKSYAKHAKFVRHSTRQLGGMIAGGRSKQVLGAMKATGNTLNKRAAQARRTLKRFG